MEGCRPLLMAATSGVLNSRTIPSVAPVMKRKPAGEKEAHRISSRANDLQWNFIGVALNERCCRLIDQNLAYPSEHVDIRTTSLVELSWGRNSKVRMGEKALMVKRWWPTRRSQKVMYPSIDPTARTVLLGSKLMSDTQFYKMEIVKGTMSVLVPSAIATNTRESHFEHTRPLQGHHHLPLL